MSGSRSKPYIKQQVKNLIAAKMKQEAEMSRQKKKLLATVNKDRIYRLFEEYKQFMNWSNCTASFDIKPIDDASQTGRNRDAVLRPPANIDDPYVLEIDAEYLGCAPEHHPLFFHEFTHLYDEENMREHFWKIGAPHAFSWYTESCATEVELMKTFGYTDYNSCEKVDASIVFCYDDQEMDLSGFIKDRISDIKFFYNKNIIGTSIKHAQYIAGALRFGNLHASGIGIGDDDSNYLRQFLGDGFEIMFEILQRSKISGKAISQVHSLNDIILCHIATQHQVKH